MSYPYIKIGGAKFSLIKPYTVNDRLIKEISTDRMVSIAHDYNHHESDTMLVRVSTFDDFQRCYTYNSSNTETICSMITDVYERWLCETPWEMSLSANEPITYRDEANGYIAAECRRMLGHCENANILDYLIADIQEQCDHIRRHGINDCGFRLAEQGRMCTEAVISTANLTRGRSRYTTLDELTTFYNSPWLTGSDSIIHSHHYIPTYQKHYVENEDESTTLLLGAEIEVDCGGKSATHAKEVLKIINGENTWDSEENIYCVHDGSLTSGLEFPTQPGSLAWHKSLPYAKMFKYLDDNGYKAHDTQTCGLHVHINRSFFKDKESECIGKLIYIIERFNDEFSILGRRNCKYSKLLGYNGEKCKELYQKGYQNKDKYNAINLLHADTIEIRAFKGTLKYSTFINTLEFVSDLAHFVRDHSDEEIENMKWADLYNTFSDELKEYYDGREKIESEKVSATTYCGATSINSNQTMIPPSVVSSILNLQPITNPTLSIDFSSDSNHDEIVRIVDAINGVSTELYTFSTMAEAFNNTTETLVSAMNNCEGNTKEDELKNLKKQLKTERNYLTKLNLRRRIDKLQREINRDKRQNRQSA